MGDIESKMVWCIKKDRGISLIEPSENLSTSYLAKAREALEVMRTLDGKSSSWTMTSCYYCMYYSVYAVLMRIGIKSEIHSCTQVLIRFVLDDFFDSKDADMVSDAFEERIDNQYYTAASTNTEKQKALLGGAVNLYEKTQRSLARMTEANIQQKRKKVLDLITMVERKRRRGKRQ